MSQKKEPAQEMQSIKEINTETKEGEYLLMALASLTASPSIVINGEELNGRQMEPDAVLQKLTPVVNHVYPASNPIDDCDFCHGDREYEVNVNGADVPVECSFCKEEANQDSTGRELFVYDTINGEMAEVADLKDAEKYVRECFTEGNTAHPDYWGFDLYEKVGKVDSNCKASFAATPTRENPTPDTGLSKEEILP